MQERVNALDRLLGPGEYMAPSTPADEAEGNVPNYPNYPLNLSNLILSTKVFIKK